MCSRAAESRWYSANDPAAVTTRFLADADNVSSLFTDGLAGMAVDSLKILGILVSIALFSPWLLALALAFLPVIWFVTRHCFSQPRRASKPRAARALSTAISWRPSARLPMLRGFAKEGFMEARLLRPARREFRHAAGRELLRRRLPRDPHKLARFAAICAVVLLAGPVRCPG